MIGSTIRVYIAGTLRIAVTDTGGIVAAGHAGLVFRGAGPATATTGLHIGELRTDDVEEPEATITFVAAGTSASATSPGTVSPGMPAGVAANDLLVMAIYGVDGVVPAVPDRLDGADQRRRDGWAAGGDDADLSKRRLGAYGDEHRRRRHHRPDRRISRL